MILTFCIILGGETALQLNINDSKIHNFHLLRHQASGKSRLIEWFKPPRTNNNNKYNNDNNSNNKLSL